MKKRMILMALLSSPFLVSAGELSLSKNMVYFDGNAQKRDVVSVNSLLPEQNVYFSTRVREVLSPEKGLQSDYAEFDSPLEAGLFVTPNKAVITPQDKKVPISIINTNANLEKERIYRIDVTPAIPPIPSSKKSEARLKMLVAYDVLVFVQPENPTLDYRYRYAEDNKFTFINKGNTHVALEDGKQCNAQQQCSPIAGGLVFSGTDASVGVQPDTVTVSYDIVLRGKGRERVSFEK